MSLKYVFLPFRGVYDWAFIKRAGQGSQTLNGGTLTVANGILTVHNGIVVISGNIIISGTGEIVVI